MDIIRIEYPSKGFARKAIAALKRGQRVTVCVRPGWRTKVLKTELLHIPTSKGEALNPSASTKRFPTYKIAVFMISLSTVHFYAISGGYRMRSEERGGLELSYQLEADHVTARDDTKSQ